MNKGLLVCGERVVRAGPMDVDKVEERSLARLRPVSLNSMAGLRRNRAACETSRASGDRGGSTAVQAETVVIMRRVACAGLISVVVVVVVVLHRPRRRERDIGGGEHEPNGGDSLHHHPSSVAALLGYWGCWRSNAGRKLLR